MFGREDWEGEDNNMMMPPGYTSSPCEGGGTVYRAPASIGDVNTIQVFRPTAQYPNGYWRQFDSKGSPIDPSTGKYGIGPQNHLVPLPPDFFK